MPCHSPGAARWFDMLISSRLDPASGQLRRAIDELAAVIRDTRTASAELLG